jgi:hypothetical protein
MRRREALAAKDENRKPKTLYAWDFLLRVEDVSRQGALRFRRPDDETFLAHDTLTVPPTEHRADPRGPCNRMYRHARCHPSQTFHLISIPGDRPGQPEYMR